MDYNYKNKIKFRLILLSSIKDIKRKRQKTLEKYMEEIQKDMKVSIEEVITANEKVVFKLPKELN